MDQPQRDHILDDLKGIVKGELLFDDVSRVLYSTDASIFQVQPLGVAVPRDEEDLQALVRYAAERRIALVPRGAGSGVAGEALGSGIIVDLSRHFRGIVEVGSDRVRVQAGVVYRDLNVRLAREGRRFAPDPASGAQCTIGGMLATNASGARAIRHGYTRDYVEGLRIVLDSGEAAAVGRESRWGPGLPGRLGEIVPKIANLLERRAELLTEQARLRFNRCGYLLHDVLLPNHVDLARLLVGSEGTLAFFTEATLRTVPLPAGRSLVLLCFASLETALRGVRLILPTAPSACELIDHRLLTLAKESDPAVSAQVPPGTEAVLLVEYESETSSGASVAAAELAERLYRQDRLALHALTASEAEAMERLWCLRETALPNLYGLRGGANPVAFVEDVGVPVEALSAYLRQVQEVLRKYETTASFLAHACTGQVHTRPFLDLQRPEDVAKLWAIADEVHNLALNLGGTVSAQHGTGLARTPWVARQYGRLYPVLRAVKEIFDPQQLLNPGKIIARDAELPTWPLRKALPVETPVADAPGSPVNPGVDTPGSPRIPLSTQHSALSTHLCWKPGEMQAEVVHCNGCGDCRTEAPTQRMCPMFRANPIEAAAPRAKANLLRHLLQQPADSRRLSSDDVREVADLCVNCKMCALECPAHVNIPKMMLEAKAANVAEHGLGRSNWVLARLEMLSALGSALAFPANAVLANPIGRWLVEKLFNVSRKRRLPKFASPTFLQRAERRGWTTLPRSDRPRVAYFVDVFANYNDPQIGEATVAVLRHNGFEVYVPPGQVGSGSAPLAQGDVEAAREAAQTNLRVFAELAREGYFIVCSEPSAALMLRKDYLNLEDNHDARLVSERTVELTSFLGDLHRQGKLRTDFKPLDLMIGHHIPCHVKALGRPPAGPSLLALIPTLRTHTIDVSCSGMAGGFGLLAENYAVSLAMGRPMLEELAYPQVRFGSTECGACRIQMEDAGGKRTLHPVQYLALAYGLMPEISRRLERPIRGWMLR